MRAVGVKKVSVTNSKIVSIMEERMGGEAAVVARFVEAYRQIREHEKDGQLQIDLRIDLTQEGT